MLDAFLASPRRYRVGSAVYATKLLADIHAARTGLTVDSFDLGPTDLQPIPVIPHVALVSYWLVDSPAWLGMRVMYELDGEGQCDLIEMRDDGTLHAFYGEVPADIAQEIGTAIDRRDTTSPLFRGWETGEEARQAYCDFYSLDEDLPPCDPPELAHEQLGQSLPAWGGK